MECLNGTMDGGLVHPVLSLLLTEGITQLGAIVPELLLAQYWRGVVRYAMLTLRKG